MKTSSVDEAHKRFLFEAGADTTPHSGRTLYIHLEGVHRRLHDWGNEESVCVAGLFHSVYGTSAFKQQIIPLELRGRVRALIGEKAEALAYLFCVCERHACLGPLLYGTSKMKNMASGEEIGIDEETLRCMLELEVANFVDHFPGGRIDNPGARAEMLLKTYLMTTERYLSKGAYGAIQSIYANTYPTPAATAG
ncbi:hypothetical protein PRJ39_23210 [Lysobacter enzymogenes]|uniref:DUF6817 domain-containing protein n=1 Tax=Lysobacter enzymogenes TaxID=69 RepID=UPI0037482AF9